MARAVNDAALSDPVYISKNRRGKMYHFIWNPTASSGMGRKAWRQIRPILKAKGVKYTVHMFRKEENLVSFVQRITKGTQQSHIIVLGGDGTLNLVLNSIDNMEHTVLSCLRIGSGNDFARNVGVEKDIQKALLHLLNEPEEIELDYGEAVYLTAEGEQKKRRFMISSGLGYDADICEEAGRSALKKLLNRIRMGKLVYVAIGIKQIFTRRNTKAKLYLDDSSPIRIHNLFFAVGMIHKMEGGGVPFCPHANPEDGQLDICLAKGTSAGRLLLEVIMVYFKKHLLFSNISEYRCRRMRIVAEKPQWIHMDGETPCQVKEATLTCCQGLRFVK